ncbi:M3 family metallopeptidase [soil metagenome]
MNPLLDFSHLPRFDTITPEAVTPAMTQLLDEARAAVVRMTSADVAPTWDDFIEPLDDATERLSRAWSMVGHLNAVADTPELRAVYNENLPRVTEFWTELSQNLALYDKYKALAASPDFATLNAARKRSIQNAVRDFRLGGAELDDAAKERFAEIQEQQAATGQRFSENVLDATNDWSLLLADEAQLAGLPEDERQAARERAEQDGQAGFKISLQYPSYYPVLQYADDRALRETVYRANSTKAAEFGRSEWDNGPLIVELLKLRQEEAELLGYGNFAEVSLVSKMAETPAEVVSFLTDMARRAKPYALRDIRELREFAARELGLATLEPWDVAYASDKLREKRFAYSESEVKRYFPEPKALGGLFRVIETLFSVKVLPDTAPVWHKDVQFFRIERSDGTLVGQFYTDLHARNGKRSGAWMDDARGRRMRASGVQTPVAYLTCNFAPPVGKRPALLTHDEVITLFHEFGHGLHHMLTRVDDLAVSGINGVEWDAVELPSQFMENFCWEWDVVRDMTAHVDTGAPLPRELFDKMIAARNFEAGMVTMRQLEFGLFDMRLHTSAERDSIDVASVQRVLDDVRAEVAVIPSPAYNRFQNSFSHIFAGGYAAGYYSYKWAEVLSADAYGQFEENGVLDSKTGNRFLDEILSVGGSRPALESFVAFRGRKPSIDALMRHSGMTDAAPDLSMA